MFHEDKNELPYIDHLPILLEVYTFVGEPYMMKNDHKNQLDS